MDEFYCADDYFSALQAAQAAWNGNVVEATPAQVAVAWGRGDPNHP
jgi:hypothetical protein